MILKVKEKTISIFYLIKFQILNRNKSFTIISSNCVGSGIYEDLNIRYNTPTIGLFFYAPCYIKFIYNLQYYLDQPLTFQNYSKYTNSHTIYPIGQLKDIEIHFQHYKSEEEAFDKWNRRKERINYTNIFYIFSDRDLCTLKELKDFDAFNSENKICFTAKQYPEFESSLWLKEFSNEETIGDLYSSRLYRKYIRFINWLN